MIANFYEIKGLEEWIDPNRGCIYDNGTVFVALNAMPATFGHSLVIPRKIVTKLSQLTPDEQILFILAKEMGEEELIRRIREEPERILEVYKLWNEDPELEKKLRGSKARRELVVSDLEAGFCNGSHYFENNGESAGQLVESFHGQITPRYGIGKGAGTAIFEFTHRKN